MCEMDLFFLLSIIYHMTFDIIIIEGAQIKFYCVHSTIFINTQCCQVDHQIKLRKDSYM